MISSPAELLDKMRRLRNYCDLSQEAVAREMGISQPAYCKLERGQTRLTVPYLQVFADLVGIPLNDLLTCTMDDLIHQINDRNFSAPPPENERANA
ncbi:MAG: helix-turn-helix transcriptional regulator [Saprospiraceae bacterium]|nr:helix-turn-helix transcriptional regulator [Saprospiraceae bacterium]